MNEGRFRVFEFAGYVASEAEVGVLINGTWD